MGHPKGVDDLRRIAEAAGRLGPSSVPPPDHVRQALLDQVSRERARIERRDRIGRSWAGFALAASALLVAALGAGRPPAPDARQPWRILRSGVAGVHQRLVGGDGNTASRMGAFAPGTDGWLAAAMRRSGMAGVAPPEFSLAQAGWMPQAAVPLAGGGLAIHMRRGELALTAAMIPGGVDAIPPGGVRSTVQGQTLRTFERDGLSWVFWHEGGVLCVVTSRARPGDLVQQVAAGFSPS